jgi:hypothetical protein
MHESSLLADADHVFEGPTLDHVMKQFAIAFPPRAVRSARSGHIYHAKLRVPKSQRDQALAMLNRLHKRCPGWKFGLGSASQSDDYCQMLVNQVEVPPAVTPAPGAASAFTAWLSKLLAALGLRSGASAVTGPDPGEVREQFQKAYVAAKRRQGYARNDQAQHLTITYTFLAWAPVLAQLQREAESKGRTVQLNYAGDQTMDGDLLLEGIHSKILIVLDHGAMKGTGSNAPAGGGALPLQPQTPSPHPKTGPELPARQEPTLGPENPPTSARDAVNSAVGSTGSSLMDSTEQFEGDGPIGGQELALTVTVRRVIPGRPGTSASETLRMDHGASLTIGRCGPHAALFAGMCAAVGAGNRLSKSLDKALLLQVSADGAIVASSPVPAEFQTLNGPPLATGQALGYPLTLRYQDLIVGLAMLQADHVATE